MEPIEFFIVFLLLTILVVLFTLLIVLIVHLVKPEKSPLEEIILRKFLKD